MNRSTREVRVRRGGLRAALPAALCAALVPVLLASVLAAVLATGCAVRISRPPASPPGPGPDASQGATSGPSHSPSPSPGETPSRPAVGPEPAASASADPAGPTQRPRGVVLMIGDGMGVSQITFARQLLLEPGERFRFETLPELGLVTTWSASNPTTDSGAAATAMASGVKTSNLYVGVDADARPVRSLAEEARDRGWKVGYATTTTVTHATPAAFYAHVPDRYADEDLIAQQLLEHRPDVVLGGGLSRFLPAAENVGDRDDGRDLLAEARAAGYEIWRRGDALDRPPPERLLGLLAPSHLAFQLDDRRRPPPERDPALADLVRLALRSLGDAPGFLLVVEGGRIDHAGHAFDAASVAAETAAFDDAVAAVLEFRRANPGVLVLVTADHASGGLALNDYVDWDEIRAQRASVEWMARQIRGAGAGPELVAEMTGYDDITDADLEPVREGELIYDANRALGRLLSARNGVTWVPRISDDTFGHTGEDVPLWAAGPGAERFAGVLDNTDIYRRLRDLLGWPPVQQASP